MIKRKGNIGNGNVLIVILIIIGIMWMFGFGGFGGGGGGGNKDNQNNTNPSKEPRTINESDKGYSIYIKIKNSTIYIDNIQVDIKKVVDYIKSKQSEKKQSEKKQSVIVIKTEADVITFDQLSEDLNKEGILFTTE